MPHPGGRVALVALALSVLAATFLGGAHPVAATRGSGAQTQDDPAPADSGRDRGSELLDISSVTPWVAPDGEFQVRFVPTTQVPAGAELTYTIHQALAPSSSSSLRAQVEAVLAGGTPGRILQRPTSRPLAEYGDPTAGSALTIPVRSESGDTSRALLPNPGIHPVELVLTDPSGPELWRQVVFLNRLPNPSSESTAASGTGTTTTTTPRTRGTVEAPPVAVTLLVPIDTPPVLDLAGVPSFDLEQRTTLDAATALLTSTPDAPLTLGMRPNTLDGLARTAERWSDRLIGALRDAVAATGGSASPQGSAALLGLPYVHVDTGALVAADAGDEIGRQRLLGAQVTSEVIGAPGTDTTWALDDTVTTESLGLLSSLGVDGVVVPASMLALGGGVTEEQVTTRAVTLDGGEGVRAIAYDGTLSQRLADNSVEPGVRAHEVVSLLMASWFTSQRDGRPAASVILVPPTIDAGVIETLTPSLDGAGPLVADTAAPILPGVATDEPRVELRGRDVPDQRGLVADSEETQRQIAAYQSMVGATNPAVSLWERMDAQTLATDLDAAGRAGLRDSIRGQIAAELAQIQPPRERRVLLTSREQTIPLRLRNDLPYEVRLLLRARSPRLDVEGGESHMITLAPGDNRIELPVSVQAPGESLLRIELATPDDGMQLASIDVPVRSTAISGVGAALSVISVVFLVLWWIHTHRRRRREHARANGPHPATAATSAATVPTDAAPEPAHAATTVDSTPASVRTDSVTEGG